MSSRPVWNFRPDEDAERVVEKVQEHVDVVDNRSDAINLLLHLQADLLESGGMDMIFTLMAMESPVIVAESEHEQIKSAVKEAIREAEMEGAGAGGDDDSV